MNGNRDTNESGSERRREVRSPSLYSASLHNGTPDAVDCVVRDISPGGARVAVERGIAERDNLVLDIDGLGLFRSKIVWRSAQEAGLQFIGGPTA